MTLDMSKMQKAYTNTTLERTFRDMNLPLVVGTCGQGSEPCIVNIGLPSAPRE